jgi:hypothetical protein
MTTSTKIDAMAILEKRGLDREEFLIKLLNSPSKKETIQGEDGKSYTFCGRGSCNLYLVVIDSDKESSASYTDWVEIYSMSDH